jgi:hypothetical protein
LSRPFATRLRYVTPPNLPSINFVISSVRYYICSADRIFGGGRAFGGGAFGGGCASVVAAYSVAAYPGGRAFVVAEGGKAYGRAACVYLEFFFP